MDGIRQGLSLCAQTLLPSLFPFLVLSELLVAIGAGGILGRLLGRPVSALLGLSAQGSTALLLGMICGQPVTTVSAAALYQRGEIEKEELERLVLFGNNPSSGFLIGAVGGGLFCNKGVGIALFCITWLSALVVGIVLRFFSKKPPIFSIIPSNGSKNKASISLITQSVQRGLSTMLQICAFVLFFSCIASCIAPLLEALSLPHFAKILTYGLLELSSGISRAVTTLPPAIAFRAAAFFSGFAGLSVCLQVFSVTDGIGIRMPLYLLSKLCQGALCLVFSWLYLHFFKPDITPQTAVGSFTLYHRGLAPGAVALVLLFYVILVIKEKRGAKSTSR